MFNKAVPDVIFDVVGGGGDGDGGGGGGIKNSPNKVSPPKVWSPKKSVGKRKTPSQGSGGIVIRLPLLLRLPPALWPTHSITPNSLLQRKGIYDGCLGWLLSLLQCH